MRIRFRSKIVKPNIIRIPKGLLYGTVLRDYMEQGRYVTVEILLEEDEE